MSFDPWNGRTTIRLGDAQAALGDAPIITAPSRPLAPAAPIYTTTTVSSPRKSAPDGLHWTVTVQGRPSGATPVVTWTVQHAKAPAEPAPPAPAPLAHARPTLGGSARSISRHLTATWDATGGSKPTTIAT